MRQVAITLILREDKMEKNKFKNNLNKKITTFIFFACFLVISFFSFTHLEDKIFPIDLLDNFKQTMNLNVQEVWVSGRENTKLEEIVSAINIKLGDPILSLDLFSYREALIDLPWIVNAKISLELPNKLNIKIIEHTPGAILKNGDQLFLVNILGKTLYNVDPNHFSDLPIVIGQGAADNLLELKQILLSAPLINKHVTAASYISKRRWNLHFGEKMIAKLPSEKPDLAIQRLEEIDALYNFLSQDIAVIDLRFNDRLILKLGSSYKQKNILGRDT